MSADESMDGAPIDPLCPVHSIVALPGSSSPDALGTIVLTDQQTAAERERYTHCGNIHADYFQALVERRVPVELAAMMTREMANVYWNIELRR